MPVASAQLSAARRHSILLLSFATFSSMAAQRICDAMLPELSRVFHVSLAETAQVVSVFAIVYGVLQLVYGPLGDRMGKFRVIAWATLACSAGNVLAVFATSLDILLLSRALVACAAAAIIPLTLAWIGDAANPEQLQETIARVGLGSALGIGAGQFFGGVLTDTLGWRWAFALLAVLFCVVGAMLLGDLRRQHSARHDEGGRNTAPMAARQHFAAQSWAIISGPWSGVILLVGLLEGAAGMGVLAIWALHLHQALDYSLSVAGAIVALFGAGGVLYMSLARQLIRRLRQPQLALLGTAMLALAALLIAFTPYGWLTVPASLLGGFGFFCFHNVMQANAAQMMPAARGTAVSLFAASLFLGQSLGVQLAAHMAQRIGAASVIALGGLTLFGLGLGFSRALRRRARH